MAVPSRRSGVPAMTRVPAARAGGILGQSPISGSGWSRSGRWTCRFSPITVLGRLRGPSWAACGNLRGDAFRACTYRNRLAPLVAPGDTDRDAGGAEQTRGRLRDLLQRPFGIARRAGDGVQDFGAGDLAIA